MSRRRRAIIKHQREARALKGATAAACINCQHWDTAAAKYYQRKGMPYEIGRCRMIEETFAEIPEPGKANVITDDNRPAVLLTADTFFCALFKRKPKSDPRRDGQ